MSQSHYCTDIIVGSATPETAVSGIRFFANVVDIPAVLPDLVNGSFASAYKIRAVQIDVGGSRVLECAAH